MLSRGYLQLLKKEEFIEYTRNIKNICIKYGIERLDIAPQITAMQDMIYRLDSVLIFDRTKAYTKELDKLNRNRNDRVNGLRFGFLMNTYHRDPEKKAASKLLLDRLDSYGTGIARMNNETESTVIHNFVDDCENTNIYKNAIALLGLGEWVAGLKADNEAYRKLYGDRIKKQSRNKKISFTKLKPQAIKIHEALSRRINAHVELYEIGKYDMLTNQLATLKGRYMQIINTRKQNYNNSKGNTDRDIEGTAGEGKDTEG